MKLYSRNGHGDEDLDHRLFHKAVPHSLERPASEIIWGSGSPQYQVTEDSSDRRIDIFASHNHNVVGMVQLRLCAPGEVQYGTLNPTITEYVRTLRSDHVYITWTQVHSDYCYSTGKFGKTHSVIEHLTAVVKEFMRQRRLTILVSFDTKSPGRYTRAGFALQPGYSNEWYSLWYLPPAGH